MILQKLQITEYELCYLTVPPTKLILMNRNIQGVMWRVPQGGVQPNVKQTQLWSRDGVPNRSYGTPRSNTNARD